MVEWYKYVGLLGLSLAGITVLYSWVKQFTPTVQEQSLKAKS